MTSRLKRTAGLLALAAVAALPVKAEWTSSREVTVTPWPGFPMLIPITLDYDGATPVAAITGRLQYNPDRFTNPQIFPSKGAPDFTAIGHEEAPGQFRFILFSSPTQNIWNGVQALIFSLDPITPLPKEGGETISFGAPEAASSEGVQLLDVDFANVNVVFLRNNARRDWMLYE